MRYNKKQKLKFALFRFVEAELSDYPETKKKLIELRSDIILRSPLPEEGSYINSRNNVSKPTEKTAVMLITNKRLEQMERTVNAIEKTMKGLDKDRLKLVEMRYFERRFAPVGIATELSISERTFYNWRDDVIKMIAVEMGLVNAVDVV